MPSSLSILDHVSALTDPRQSWRVVYPLPEILLLILCATLCGWFEAVAEAERGGAHPQFAEPRLRRLWAGWFSRRLARHRATDDGPAFETMRLAADGAWLAFLFREDGGPVPDLPAHRDRLLAMTRSSLDGPPWSTTQQVDPMARRLRRRAPDLVLILIDDDHSLSIAPAQEGEI